MSTAAMVTGIIAAVSLFLLFLFVPFLPFVMAGTSITLALLSRGGNKKFSAYAKTGLITSSCTLGIATLVFVLLFALIVNSDGYREEFIEEFNRTYEDVYGEPFEFDLSNDSFTVR